MSNDAAGRALRGIAIGRRNWTLCGSDSGGHRAAAMPAWLCSYNSCRPQSALGGRPPISRLKDNVLGIDI
jgi:hypothetical protein